MLFKTSWHQEHIERWQSQFGRAAEILCRVVLLNVEGRSALSCQGDNIVGKGPIDAKGGQSDQIWVFVKVSGGVLLVNEGTGAHIVARGWSEPVACNHDPIDDRRALWEIDYEAGHMMFRNKEFDDCFLDLSNGKGFNGSPVYLWNGDGAKQQQWKETRLPLLTT